MKIKNLLNNLKMKAKLIKTDKDNYILFDEKGVPIGTTPNVLSNNTFSKLSKQNCDEIFGVVDVHKLAGELYSGHVMAVDWQLEKSGFIKGFNKAMELNKDKVFTLEQAVEMAKILVSNPYEKSGKTAQELVDAYIQSLQKPTEIEVEIEMNSWFKNGYSGTMEDTTPKLDSEGYIILKKI